MKTHFLLNFVPGVCGNILIALHKLHIGVTDVCLHHTGINWQPHQGALYLPKNVQFVMGAVHTSQLYPTFMESMVY